MKRGMDDGGGVDKMRSVLSFTNGFVGSLSREGTGVFEKAAAARTIELFEENIDSWARADPQRYFHLYEWRSVGDKSGRLFETYVDKSSTGNSIRYRFLPSRTVAEGGQEPFVWKAPVMESGSPVVIKPKNASLLKFLGDSGDTVYHPGPLVVSEPGGSATTGAFENTFLNFMDKSTEELKVDGFFDEALSSIKKSGESGVLQAAQSVKSGLAVGQAAARNLLSRVAKR